MPSKRRSSGPKCIVCGRPATLVVYLTRDGFRVRQIRSAKVGQRKARKA
jgi:hypothetical protein